MRRWLLVFSLTVVLGCRSAQQTVAPREPPPNGGHPTGGASASQHVQPASYTEFAATVPEPARVAYPEPPAGETAPEELPAPPGTEIRAWMTMTDFEALALRSNPALAAADARVEAARGKWIQAGLYPNTVVGYSSSEIGAAGTAGMQGGFLSQRLITGGKRRLDRAVAAREIDRAGFELQATRQRVLNDVRIRFYDVLVAQREVELTAELVRVGDESAQASSKLLAGEQISRTNLLQAEIEAEQARILHDNALNDHFQAWRQLGAVVGTDALEVSPVEGDIEQDVPDCTWEACLESILRGHPELDAARADIRRDRLALRRAYRERIPDVDLTVVVRHDDLSGDDVVNVQTGLPIPWLDRNQGNIYRARSELSAAYAQLRKLELRLQDRLASELRRYANARQQAQRYAKQILPRAEESLRWVQAGYREGQLDYLTLLIAQRTYFQANLAYLRAVRQLRQSQVVLEGKLLTGSLEKRTL